LYQSLENRLRALSREDCGTLIGLEKECLRVSPDGGIAQTGHPVALGSALAHPYITTDYSEALAELITPPFPRPEDALDFLRDAQKFVYDALGDEILWTTSMPCVISGGENIPIARYGSSNAGLMKHVYRRGLGHRYGRVMQVIAGVHFNFSMVDGFWGLFQQLEGDSRPIRGFTDAAYLGLTRNLQRFGWLIPYLFGASPAVCKSFLGGRPTSLEEFDETTYYEPFATSLRMGDIGYTNSKEKGIGIKANYNTLGAYIDSLTHAIETSSPQWERIGVKVDGEYRQLNSNILQIENEYYSTVRPKQILEGLEKPTLALRRRGVRYVELRSLDVDVYRPLGVSGQQLHFLRAFMLFCLLHDSPPINIQERREIDQNLGGAAHRGRDPSLCLYRNGREILLREWADEICDAMQGVCELLDGTDPGRPHASSLAAQRECVANPERTPSARILAEMRERKEGFFQFAWRMSLQHRDYFRQLTLAEPRRREFEEEAAASLQRQEVLEASDQVGFDQFLEDYFAQS
jgi:glutamate--cysteine ligase